MMIIIQKRICFLTTIFFIEFKYEEGRGIYNKSKRCFYGYIWKDQRFEFMTKSRDY
jgi:hypothetical protein